MCREPTTSVSQDVDLTSYECFVFDCDGVLWHGDTPIEGARELVEQGSEKIGAIAQQCGFLTLRNFHRAFVREFGVPPAVYRNRNRSLKGG